MTNPHPIRAVKPDYSPAMLSLFLNARIAFRALVDDCSRVVARRDVIEAMRAKTGLKPTQIIAAISGKLKDENARVQLWHALDVRLAGEVG